MTLRHVTCLAILVASGCETHRGARVALDLTPLWQHAAQAAMTLSHVELRVTAADLDARLISIDPGTLAFELELPAGPERAFEVRAFAASDAALVYWGHTQVDLAPRGDVDVTIPTFPAGVTSGNVSLADGASADGVEIAFKIDDAQNGRPAEHRVTLKGGTFWLPLPTGNYVVGVLKAPYDFAAPVSFAMTQGAQLDLGALVLVTPTQVVPGVRPPQGLPIAGVGGAAGLLPGARRLGSQSHKLHIGAVSNIARVTTQSESYRLRPAVPTQTRSSP